MAGALTGRGGRPAGAAASIARGLARARRRREGWRALALVAPLLAFLLFTFALPLGQMVLRSVHDDGFSAHMPRLVAWFAAHPRGQAPDEAAWAALSGDLAAAAEARTIGRVGERINHALPGTRSLFTATARQAAGLHAPYGAAFGDPRWHDGRLWAAMRDASHAFGARAYLAALDLGRDEAGRIVAAPPEQRIHLRLFARSFALAGLVTALVTVLGFPLAHLLATLPARRAASLLVAVLLPFWTSILVRTTAWIALLQRHGIVNDLLVGSGLVGEGSRLDLLYGRGATVIVMTNILLPFLVLPLLAVMRGVDPDQMRVARSLGAGGWTAFRRIYLPQVATGLRAGMLFVFILAVGYYITPALVGGASGQMIANEIARRVTVLPDWSLAAALSVLLTAAVLALALLGAAWMRQGVRR